MSTVTFSTPAFLTTARALGIEPPAIHWPATATSTNDELVAALTQTPRNWPDFAIYGTDYQTAGKGRLDRTWVVAPGEALTFSTLVRLPAHSPATSWIPLITGWAVADTLRAAGVDATVKWPNDVLVGGKKICGILCRFVPLLSAEVVAPHAPTAPAAGTSSPAAVVIGIGLNVTVTQLPVPTATSVHEYADISREDLLAGIMSRLIPALAEVRDAPNPAATSAIKNARDAIATVGKQVTVSLPSGDTLTGTATGVSPAADLIVATATGEHAVSAGDVVHVRPA